jgi:hypothetical protein
LISLHGSAFLLFPLVYSLSLIIYYFKQKDWLGPLTSVVFSVILSLPYLLGEIGRGWSNTQTLIQLVVGESSKNSLWSLFDRLIFTFTETSKLGYFLKPALFDFAVIFLVLVLTLSLLYFRGNRQLYWSLLGLYGGFLLISANFQGYLEFYYLAILWSMPLILTITALAYFPYSKNFTKLVLVVLVLGGMIISLYVNLINTRTVLASKYGPVRIVNTRDIQLILSEIPPGSTVCKSWYRIKPYDYIDDYVTQRNLSWREHGNCNTADYYLLADNEANYSHFVPGSNPKVRAGQFYNFLYQPMIDTQITEPDWRLWKEAHLHKLYVRQQPAE